MILAVTNDIYELPVLIEDSYKAMARKAGVDPSLVSRQCRGIHGSRGKLKFVEVSDDYSDEFDSTTTSVGVSE